MNIIKKALTLSFLCICLVTFLSAAEEASPAEYKLYTQALEKLLTAETPEAVILFNRLLAQYPDTPLRGKAEMYLGMYANKLDRSGGIPFYLGWLGTGIFAAESIPVLFNIRNIYLYSGMGILGVGSGLWAAYMLSRDQNMSAGQDLWIETTMAVTMLNLFFTLQIGEELFITPWREAAGEDWTKITEIDDLWWDINYASLLTVAVSSRLLTYRQVSGQTPSLGRIGFIALSYAWAHSYYWLTMIGVFDSENQVLNNALGIIIPDAIAVGSYFFWERLGWSLTRSGIVTVGGLGGHLIAGFVNLSLTELIDAYPTEAIFALQMGFSLGAKFLTAHLTRNMDNDLKYNSIMEAKQLSVYPVITPDGFAIRGSFSF